MAAETPLEAVLRAENVRLREQLALRDLALDGVQTTFVVADRTTPDPTVLYCNKIVGQMLGVRPDELIGKSIRVFFQNNVTQNWGAVTVTPAGRIQRWLYSGGPAAVWVRY